MDTQIVTIDAGGDVRSVARRAADALAAGQIVVFPTETVYGVAASAARPDALERLREAKGPGGAIPWTFHLGRRGDLDRFVPDVSPLLRRLVQKGWPGPVTLVVRVPDPGGAAVYPRLSESVATETFGSGAIWLRCPDDPLSTELFTVVEAPIVACSANRIGQAACVTGAEALAQLGGRVELVLDAGRTRYARPSTIVEVNGDGYTVRRVGVFDDRTIRRLTSYSLLFVCSGNTCRSPMAEALARRMLAEKLGCRPDELVARGVLVSSAGTHSFGGAPASPEAVDICAERGAELHRHRSRHLTPDMVHAADRIYAMTQEHVDAILDLSREAGEKVVRLDPSADVVDPVGGTREEYAACADRITAALSRRLNEVLI